MGVGVQRRWIGCAGANCEKCVLLDEAEFITLRTNIEHSLVKIKEGEDTKLLKDLVLETILKDKLYNWIICELHGDGSGLKAYDDNGQAVIHLIAALGFDWAIAPIVRAGVEVGYKDLEGHDAYQWASRYGRLECVTTLKAILSKSEVEKSLPEEVEKSLPLEAKRSGKSLRFDKKKQQHVPKVDKKQQQQAPKKVSAPSEKRECQLCHRVLDSQEAFDKHVEAHVLEFHQGMQFDHWKKTMLNLIKAKGGIAVPSPSGSPSDNEPSTSGRQ